MCDKTDLDVWKRHLYSEAWKQYSHEDNLGQKRNSFFLGAQGALILLLTFAAKWLLDAEPVPIWALKIHLGMILLGLLAVRIGKLLVDMDTPWNSVIEAGKASVNMRWCTIIAIENQMGLEKIGPAYIEDGLRRHSVEPSKVKYKPFKGDRNLEWVELDAMPKVGGWKSMLKVVSILKGIHLGIKNVGWMLACLGVILSALNSLGIKV